MKRKVALALLVLSVLLASLSVFLGTAQLAYNHGNILDPDALAHVHALLHGKQTVAAPASLVTPTPTSTPRSKPTPTLTPQQIILSVFGANGAKAVRVAQCVSGINPSLVTTDTNGIYHYGIFQIRLSTLSASPYKGSNLLDPKVNTQVAYWLFMQSGSQWYRWGSCA